MEIEGSERKRRNAPNKNEKRGKLLIFKRMSSKAWENISSLLLHDARPRVTRKKKKKRKKAKIEYKNSSDKKHRERKDMKPRSSCVQGHNSIIMETVSE